MSPLKAFQSRGSRFSANSIRQRKKKSGWTAWVDSSSPWCTDSLGNWDLDVLEIAPAAAGRPLVELAMQGGPLHKKYKIYLDRVGVAKVPENYEDRLAEIFPKIFKHLRLLALDPYDLALSKLERTSKGIETM